MRPAGPVLLSVLVTALLAAAGCTSSKTGSAPTSAVPTSAAPSSTPVASPTPNPSTAAPTSAGTALTGSPARPPAVPATSAATTPSAAASSRVVPPLPPVRSTCTSVAVRVIRGSAAQGQEFAAVQFTNTGPSRCRLVGYPTVSLLLGGKDIGTPSRPSGTAVSQRTLAPGDTAESALHDYTGGSCSAPLSDSARVVVPGSTLTAVRPLQVRACVLRVDPLGPPE